MAYNPTTWECGDTITAEKLNNIEDGIQEALECCGGGGGSASSLEVGMTIDGEDAILNKTWQEIYDAFPNVFLSISEGGANIKGAILDVSQFSDAYTIRTALSFVEVFIAESADDYPIAQPK